VTLPHNWPAILGLAAIVALVVGMNLTPKKPEDPDDPPNPW
jgi:hypothetical protein